jgi:hypothetical protein
MYGNQPERKLSVDLHQQVDAVERDQSIEPNQGVANVESKDPTSQAFSVGTCLLPRGRSISDLYILLLT